MGETNNFIKKNNIHVLSMRPLFQIHLGLSNVCNMNCVHCYSRALETSSTCTKEMSRSAWIQILTDAHQLGCFKINLVYGEPLLFDHINRFIEDACSLDFDVELGTNGSTITETVAKQIWNLGVRKIHLSIDYPDTRNDKFRRFPGAFEKAKNSIAILKEYPFRVKIATSQLSTEKQFYIDFLELLINMKADALYFLPERRCRQSETNFNYRDSMAILNNFIDENYNYNIVCHDPVSKQKYNTDSYENCFVGNILHIDPDGNARLCPLWNMTIGNVVDEGLITVWEKVNSYLNDTTCDNFTCFASSYEST